MKKIASAVLLILSALLFAACAGEPFAVYPLEGGAVCRVYGSTSGIRRVELEAADGEMQVLRMETPDIEPAANAGVEWIDLDFDGDLDLTIAAKRYTTGEVRRTCYLYTEGRLVENEALSALRDLTVDAAAQQLTAWSRSRLEEEYETHARTVYVWHDGAPVPVARRELIHYIAEGEEIYRVVDSTALPGEPLAETDERWIFPEQFDDATAAELWN